MFGIGPHSSLQLFVPYCEKRVDNYKLTMCHLPFFSKFVLCLFSAAGDMSSQLSAISLRLLVTLLLHVRRDLTGPL